MFKVVFSQINELIFHNFIYFIIILISKVTTITNQSYIRITIIIIIIPTILTPKCCTIIHLVEFVLHVFPLPYLYLIIRRHQFCLFYHGIDCFRSNIRWITILSKQVFYSYTHFSLNITSFFPINASFFFN